MNKIEKIVWVRKRMGYEGVYYKTLAIVKGDEVQGWSKTKDEYQVGDLVETFFHDRTHQAKMQKRKPRSVGAKPHSSTQ